METSDCISSSIISDFTRKAIKNTFYMYAKAVFLSLSSHADKKRNGAPPQSTTEERERQTHRQRGKTTKPQKHGGEAQKQDNEAKKQDNEAKKQDNEAEKQPHRQKIGK